jgi:hypothetical protein
MTEAASASRCFQPPESVPASWSLRLVSPSCAEVLGDRQVFVKGEALRHVADLQLDVVGVAQDVEAKAGAGAFVGSEQAADHADRRRLSRAVRTEEADDLALANVEVDMIDRGAAVVVFGQAANCDDVVAVHEPSPPSRTSTGWPTFSAAAAPLSGRASTRKTSLSRLSLE